jgi:hypothetical protein
MKKTSLYIDDSVDRALAVRAAERGITKAELIRSALGAVAADPHRAKPQAIALVKDGKPEIARDIDSFLDATGFCE